MHDGRRVDVANSICIEELRLRVNQKLVSKLGVQLGKELFMLFQYAQDQLKEKV